MPPVTEQEKKDWARQDPGLKHINPGSMPNGRTDEQWAARRKGQRDSVLDGATMLDGAAPAPPTTQPRDDKGRFQSFDHPNGQPAGTRNPEPEPGDQTWDSFSGGPQTWDEAKGAWAEAGKQPYNGDSLLGGVAKLAGNLIASQIPVVGFANAVSGVLGGPTIGGALRSLVAPPNPNLPLAAPLPPQRPYDLTAPKAPATAQPAARPTPAPAAVQAPAPVAPVASQAPTARSVVTNEPPVGISRAASAAPTVAQAPAVVEALPPTEEERLAAPAAPVAPGFFENAFEQGFPQATGQGFHNGVNQVGPVTDWAAPSAVEREAMFQEDMAAQAEDERQVANAIADQRSPAQAMEKGTWADQEGVNRSMAADLPADEAPPEERSVQLNEAQAEQAQAEQQAGTISGQEWDDTLLGGDNLTTNGAVGVSDWANVEKDVIDSTISEVVDVAVQTGAVSPDKASSAGTAPSMVGAQSFVGGQPAMQDWATSATDMPNIIDGRLEVDRTARMNQAEVDIIANDLAAKTGMPVEQVREHVGTHVPDVIDNRTAVGMTGGPWRSDPIATMEQNKQFSPVNGPKTTADLRAVSYAPGQWGAVTQGYLSELAMGRPVQNEEVTGYRNPSISSRKSDAWAKEQVNVDQVGVGTGVRGAKGEQMHSLYDDPKRDVPQYGVYLDHVTPQMDKVWADASQYGGWANDGIGADKFGFNDASTSLPEWGSQPASNVDQNPRQESWTSSGANGTTFDNFNSSLNNGNDWSDASNGIQGEAADWSGGGINSGGEGGGSWDTSSTGWSGDGGWAESGTNDSGYDGGSYSGNNDGQNSPGDSARGGGSVGSNGGGYDGRGSDNSPSEGARGGGSGNSNNERGYDGGSSGYADNGGYSGQDAPSRDW